MGEAGTGPAQSRPIRSNTADFGEYLLCARSQTVNLMCIESFCLHTRKVKVDMSSLWESPLCRSDPGISYIPVETMPALSPGEDLGFIMRGQG